MAAVAHVRQQADVLAHPLKVSAELLGLTDGLNRSFSTIDKFVEGSSMVYHNGRRLRRVDDDRTPQSGEYYEAESGGTGSGFDTIVITGFTPDFHSKLLADYLLTA